MSRGVESLGRTLAVAIGVALFCSLLVSTAVYYLRPIELALGAVDRNRAILDAAGIESATLDDRQVVDRFLELEARVVALDTGEFSSAVDAASYDYRAALDDPDMRVEIPPELDGGRLGVRPRYMPVYFVRDGDRIGRIVLPMYARGMWSTIHAFVALEADLSTIAGVAFYEHGETPGIGDRIENPQWQAGWVGKRIYGPDGVVRFRITADADAVPAEYRVDGITGATVTAEAVNTATRYWFSEHGYGRLLERLREGGP